MKETQQEVPGIPMQGADLTGLIREVTDRGASFRFQVTGGSMFPFIRAGDIVTVETVRLDALRLGDILAFEHPESGRLLVHRIVSLSPEQCVPRGDNVPRDDGIAVDSHSILGRVKAVERRGQRVRFGLGLERGLIAWLSRLGILAFSWRLLRTVRRPLRNWREK